jgi:type IV pilus assembly protein PilV
MTSNSVFGTRRAAKGLTLIEVLVTLVVMSLGLLGVAALQTRGMQANHHAYYYSQASALAYEMAERIRVNPTVLNEYEMTMGESLSHVDCETSSCSTTGIAQYDLWEWVENSLKKRLGESAAASISNSSGTVTIKIRWLSRGGGNCNAAGGAGTQYSCHTLTLIP